VAGTKEILTGKDVAMTEITEKLAVGLKVLAKITLVEILNAKRVGDQEADHPVQVIPMKGGENIEVLRINVIDEAHNQATLANRKNSVTRRTNYIKRKSVRSRSKLRKLLLPNCKELT